ARRVYLAVGAAAVIVYLGVLWNGFALDDLTIIVANPLVHSLSGVWRAFALPDFPANLDASVYRPLAIATYALDWSVRSTAWFHAVDRTWRVAAGVLVGGRAGGPRRALAAFVASWAVLAAEQTGVRGAVLGGCGGSGNPAPVCRGQDGPGMRLTATGVLGDVARVLVFPRALSADYSPAGR